MAKLEKNIYKITWPIFIELSFFILLGTVDTFMLSQYSDTAVGSVGVSNQLLNLFGILVNVIGIGIGVVSAQYLGAKQVQKAKDTIVTGIVASTIIGIVLSLLVVFLGRQLLVLLGTSDSFIDDSTTYLQIVGFSIIFISLRVSLSNGFRSFSKPQVVMIIMIIGNVINIGLNAVLIYGLFGFPSLGVKGAALGTLFSRMIMVIILLIAIYKILDIKVFKLRLHIEQLKKILFVGIPSALESLMWNISQVMILFFINMMSDEAVIARTYISAMLPLVFIFSFSIAQGNSIIVGYYIGEDEKDKAYKETQHSIKIAFLSVVFTTTILNIFSTQFISFFTDDILVTKMIKNVLLFALFYELGRAMNLIYIQALRSANDTVFPVIMAIASMFGISVTLTYYLGIHLEMGLVGVYIAIALDELFRGVSMAIRWYHRNWAKFTIIESFA